MLTDAIGEEDGELEEDLSKVLDPPRPFTDDIHRCQVKHFEKCVVCRKYILAFGDFTQLAMVALYHVVRINEFANLRRMLKEGRDLGPVVAPGANNERILCTPRFLEAVKLKQCRIFRRGLVDGLQMSTQVMRMSCTPRFLSSFRTLSQNFADSFSPITWVDRMVNF